MKSCVLDLEESCAVWRGPYAVGAKLI